MVDKYIFNEAVDCQPGETCPFLGHPFNAEKSWEKPMGREIPDI